MKLYSNADIQAIHQLTLAEQGITQQQFVDRVGEALADVLVRELKPDTLTTVFAGEGDCGAYTLEACRLLCSRGYDMEVFLFNIGGNRLSAECTSCRDRLIEDQDAHCRFVEVTGLQFTMPDLDEQSVVIDGLFDGSYTGRIAGGYQHLVRNINESGARIIAIDVPSGLPVDTTGGLLSRNIINAGLTLAIGLPRITFFIGENSELVGRWRIIDAGYSRKAMRQTVANYFLTDEAEVRALLPRRRLCCSKADFGNAIIFAGSYGMMGAAILATRAAARSGCGKVTCHSPKVGQFLLQSSVPSALYEADNGDAVIGDIVLKHAYDAIAIGPGIGTADTTINALENFLKVANANGRPVVLDADALNCIGLRPTMLNYIPVKSVITPHAAEFDRLFGEQPDSESRLHKAIEMAEYYQIIIVLKGHNTCIVRPDHKVCINSGATPALATAGSGDVLTGLLTGLIAQGISPERAAVAAVYIHGIAGRIAENRHGEYGVIAEDIADSVGMAIKSLVSKQKLPALS